MLMACHLLYFIRQSKKSMKNKMIIVCVLLGLVLPLDGQTTLDDCIHYAWKHNLEFKNTQIEVQEAHTDYVAAMGKFMPSVSVQAEVGRHIGRSIDPGTNGYTSDSYNQGTVGMDVTLSLFEGFTRINRLRFTRLVQKEKEWSRLAKQNELAYQVVEAYYKVVLDEKLLQLAEEQLLLGKRYLKQTETFLILGLRSVSDLQEVKARHQGDVFRYSSYAKNRKMSLLYLKELIGMKSSAELAVVCADEVSVLALPVTNADELYWQSTRVLPDYKKMEMWERIARKELAIASGQFSPTIYARFSWGSDFYNSLFSLHQIRDHWNKYIGVGVSFPLFTGLDRYASLRKKKLNVARVRNRIEAKNNNLRIETEQVTLSLYAGWEEHRQAMLQVQAETQVLKETERKWEEGLVSVFQLMESRNRLLSAKAEQVRTRLQYELALRLADYYRTGSF